MLTNEEVINNIIHKINYLNSPEKNCTKESRIRHAIKVSLLKHGYATCNRYMYRFDKARSWLQSLKKKGIIKIEICGEQMYATLINKEEFEKRYTRNGCIPNDYKKLF